MKPFKKCGVVSGIRSLPMLTLSIGLASCQAPGEQGAVAATDPTRPVMFDTLPQGDSPGSTHASWTGRAITYCLASTPSNATRGTLLDIIQPAADQWGGVTGLQFVYSSSCSQSQIEIGFPAGAHGHEEAFDGVGGILSHARLVLDPADNSIQHAEICLDGEEPWSDSISGEADEPFDLVTAVLHVFGHTLGLEHSNISGDLLYHQYQGSVRALSWEDIQTAQEAYGDPRDEGEGGDEGDGGYTGDDQGGGTGGDDQDSGSTGPMDKDKDGWTPKGGDCDDGNPAIHPEASEVCNAQDDNCNHRVDEELSTLNWYQDNDIDGYGAGEVVAACGPLPGYAGPNGDCDDANAAVHPGASELCDGHDNDCDKSVDEGTSVKSWHPDSDGDKHGGSSSTQACAPPPGHVESGDDCDDSRASVYPGAPELCDSLDNDCDRQVDDGVGSTWYLDGDGDAFGQSGSTTVACSRPGGFADRGNDCNDSDRQIYPGASEVCFDGRDQDCDGSSDEGCNHTYPIYINAVIHDNDDWNSETCPVQSSYALAVSSGGSNTLNWKATCSDVTVSVTIKASIVGNETRLTLTGSVFDDDHGTTLNLSASKSCSVGSSCAISVYKEDYRENTIDFNATFQW